MSNTSTPGPWTVDTHDVCFGSYIILEAQERLQALWDTDLPTDTADDIDLRRQAIDDEEDANVRLIAAAPELLALVERFAAEWGRGDDFEGCTLEEIRLEGLALLARIVGETTKNGR
jgi:hypothetical protein